MLWNPPAFPSVSVCICLLISFFLECWYGQYRTWGLYSQVCPRNYLSPMLPWAPIKIGECVSRVSSTISRIPQQPIDRCRAHVPKGTLTCGRRAVSDDNDRTAPCGTWTTSGLHPVGNGRDCSYKDFKFPAGPVRGGDHGRDQLFMCRL